MKTLTLKCRICDPQNNGVDWGDAMRVTLEGVDEHSEPEEVAKLVNQATYELVAGGDEEATGTLARTAGSACHGIAWFDDSQAGDCIIEWHVAP